MNTREHKQIINWLEKYSKMDKFFIFYEEQEHKVYLLVSMKYLLSLV